MQLSFSVPCEEKSGKCNWSRYYCVLRLGHMKCYFRVILDSIPAVQAELNSCHSHQRNWRWMIDFHKSCTQNNSCEGASCTQKPQVLPCFSLKRKHLEHIKPSYYRQKVYNTREMLQASTRCFMVRRIASTSEPIRKGGHENYKTK